MEIATPNQESTMNTKTDAQLIIQIRQILASPTGHMTFKIRQMRDENLANLRAEAARRGLSV